MDQKIEIKPVQGSDAEKIAALHYTAFKGFFLTSLGKRFLEAFYKGVLSHRDGFGFGAFYGEELVGFAIGARSNTGFYKAVIKKNGIEMIFAAFWSLLLNPLKIKRLVQSFFATNGSLYKEIPVLLSICVSSQSESKGVGKKLLTTIETDLKQNNYNELILTTDTYGNEYVNRFYQNNNYTLANTFFQGKREMNLYHKNI